MSATDYFIGELYRTKALRWISVGNKKLTSRIRRAKPVLRRLGPFWRSPNILCMWGRDASIGLGDKGVKLAIARPSTFALLRAWVPRLRVPCPLFLAVCDPTCGFALPRLFSRLPRTLRFRFQGQSPNSSMFFHLRAVSFEPTCTNTILCRVQITITRYCGLFELL